MRAGEREQAGGPVGPRPLISPITRSRLTAEDVTGAAPAGRPCHMSSLLPRLERARAGRDRPDAGRPRGIHTWAARSDSGGSSNRPARCDRPRLTPESLLRVCKQHPGDSRLTPSIGRISGSDRPAWDGTSGAAGQHRASRRSPLRRRRRARPDVAAGLSAARSTPGSATGAGPATSIPRRGLATGGRNAAARVMRGLARPQRRLAPAPGSGTFDGRTRAGAVPPRGRVTEGAVDGVRAG
jgi:hypothetical protein